MENPLFSHTSNKRMRVLALAIFLPVLLSIILLQWIMERDSYGHDYPELITNNILRVAVESNPLSYYLNQNDTIGLEYELWKLLSAESGLTIEFVSMPNLYQAQEALKMQKVDVVGYLMPVSTSHPEWFVFLDPILRQKHVLVQKKEKAIKNPILLAGQTLHLMARNTIIYRLKNLSYEIGDTIHFSSIRKGSVENMINQVNKGRIKYAVVGEHLANYYSMQYPEIDIDTPLGFTQFQAWQVSSSSPILRDSINQWIQRISSSIDYQLIIEKYYPDSALE